MTHHLTPAQLWATIATLWAATVRLFWYLPPPAECLRRARLMRQGAQIMLNLNIPQIVADVEIALAEIAKIVAVVEILNDQSSQLTDDQKAAKLAELIKGGVDALAIPASVKATLENPGLDTFVAEGLVLLVKAERVKAPQGGSQDPTPPVAPAA